MGAIQAAYGANGQAITITLNSLANSTATFPQSTGIRQSTVVDNTTNLWLDALVTVLLTAGGTAANDKAVYVYAFATTDNGTSYTGSAGATDAALTMQDPTVLRLIGIIPVPTISIAYVSTPMSVAAAFGGVLPAKWGIAVRNFSGSALAASACSANYQGVYATTA